MAADEEKKKKKGKRKGLGGLSPDKKKKLKVPTWGEEGGGEERREGLGGLSPDKKKLKVPTQGGSE